MNGDTLLYWLTDRSEGSWQQFQAAVRTFGGEDAGRIWYRFATQGFIDISHSATRQWAIREPIAFVYEDGATRGRALITGARTPELLLKVRAEADSRSCIASILAIDEMPHRICVEGELVDIERLAIALSIRPILRCTDYFCGRVRPIWQTIAVSPKSNSAPINWSAKSFDFDSMSWLDGIGQRTACEFTSSFGAKRYLLHARRHHYLSMSRSEAVYSAAAIRGIELASFDASLGALKVPARAALPVPYSFWAATAAGSEGKYANGSFLYNMRDDAAVPLLVYLGRRCSPV